MTAPEVSQPEFIIKIEFEDGLTVSLGRGDELIVELDGETQSATLNDARLALVKRVQEAQEA